MHNSILLLLQLLPNFKRKQKLARIFFHYKIKSNQPTHFKLYQFGVNFIKKID